jgi:hypothetical protein
MMLEKIGSPRIEIETKAGFRYLNDQLKSE